MKIACRIVAYGSIVVLLAALFTILGCSAGRSQDGGIVLGLKAGSDGSWPDPSTSERIGEGIAGVTPILAPFLGPYGVIATGLGGVIASVLGYKAGRKNEQESTIRRDAAWDEATVRAASTPPIAPATTVVTPVPPGT